MALFSSKPGLADMPTYQFKRVQEFSVPTHVLWDFISSPANLKRITPDYMGFDITSPDLPKRMYEGMIISYTVRPLLHIPMTWVTEITHVNEGAYFVDEQRMGPYKMWHHEHHLEVMNDRVKMTDLITYTPPLGLLGAIANRLFIKKQLEEIFDYRQEVLHKLFGQ